MLEVLSEVIDTCHLRRSRVEVIVGKTGCREGYAVNLRVVKYGGGGG
jgi:hypothetical protein